MAPKFALFTKGSVALKQGFKKCLSYYSLALNPRIVCLYTPVPVLLSFSKLVMYQTYYIYLALLSYSLKKSLSGGMKKNVFYQ